MPDQRFSTSAPSSQSRSDCRSSSRSPATRARRCSKWLRPTLSPCEISSSEAGESASSPSSSQATRSSTRRRRAIGFRADRVNSRSPVAATAGGRAGGSSITRCTLVPLKPNELTAARLGRPDSRVQGLSLRFGKKGPAAKSMSGLGSSQCSVGGICACFRASSTLMTLTAAEAIIACPMLDLTEPRGQNPRRSVKARKASVRAPISIGSPSLVPVPWHST